eukprot:FR737264.1.p2 GENE.FR737264.1~~FR737264.1.p2  ORF type:complete len:103 (+),score=7.24 FR737264.1:409-717(+)
MRHIVKDSETEKKKRMKEAADAKAQLEKVVRENADKELCPVCLDQSKCVAFNCGHLVCGECAELYFVPRRRPQTGSYKRTPRPGALCPICRTAIVSCVRVYG